MHTYGTVLNTRWVTVHDTAVDGTAPFNANTAAKAAHATPFKRPENGLFRPGSHFKEFYFDETGDTNASSPENNTAGGWGSIMKISQSAPNAATGTITMFYKNTGPTSSPDNLAFLAKDALIFVQDAGDGLHTSLNALDSGYVLDLNADYSAADTTPLRWLAEGRDPSATIDSGTAGTGNEGDNEITGSTISDGDNSVDGILGAKDPNLDDPHWHFFWTQQHGDNNTWEVTLAGHSAD
jgi:secreted PhoX family phosphatase